MVNGERRVGYDNERGKGDHKHIGRQETEYEFRDIPTLLGDFWRDVKEAAHGSIDR